MRPPHVSIDFYFHTGSRPGIGPATTHTRVVYCLVCVDPAGIAVSLDKFLQEQVDTGMAVPEEQKGPVR